VLRVVILGIPVLVMSVPSNQHSTDRLRTGLLNEMDKTSTMGGTMHELMAELFRSAAASRRGCARDPAYSAASDSLGDSRGTDGHAGFRLDRAKGMEHRGRLYPGRAGQACGRFPKIESSCDQLQPAGAQKMSLDELRKHLVSLPEHPEWIPYRHELL